MHRFSPIRWLALLLFAGGAGGAAYAARLRYAPSGEMLPGLRVDGVAAQPGESARALLQRRVEALERRTVRIVLGTEPAGSLGEARLGDLGVRIDQDVVLARIRAIGHEEDWAMRVRLVDRARRGEVDVPVLASVAAGTVGAWLAPIKRAFDRPPVSARLDLRNHTVVPSREGRYIDVEGAAAAIERASRDPHTTTVALPVVGFPPRYTETYLEALKIDEVLASFETHFSRAGDQARRAQNIEVAASKLDGTVLAPGELVSFNEVVGERSEDNGFRKSWEIYKGEMVEGVGGGTCQVASTLHAAALFAGLDVLERLPHSRPSAYIAMGLDATVVYPAVDMKLRNPYPFPLVVHTRVDAATVRIELLGGARPASVAFSREVLATYPFGRKLVEQPGLSARKVVLKQHGIFGFRVKRSRKISWGDGRIRVESTTDTYPPTAEIYAVPPGFDASWLPPLQDADDGAKLADSGAMRRTTVVMTKGGRARPVVVSRDPAKPAPDDLVVIKAPGLHPPSEAQRNPVKLISLGR